MFHSQAGGDACAPSTCALSTRSHVSKVEDQSQLPGHLHATRLERLSFCRINVEVQVDSDAWAATALGSVHGATIGLRRQRNDSGSRRLKRVS